LLDGLKVGFKPAIRALAFELWVLVPCVFQNARGVSKRSGAASQADLVCLLEQRRDFLTAVHLTTRSYRAETFLGIPYSSWLMEC